MPDAIFNGWDGVLRILLIAPAAYVALILILRISGKRTLAKLNAFDFIITIAIGSTLASVITSSTLSLVAGVTALGLLVGMQFLVTAASVRWPWFNEAVKAEATLLVRHGELLHQAMRRQRIAADEIEAAIRQSGGRGVEDAEAVFLETDGSLAVILAA
ncbi:MAG: YetF domain-containing protein [Brevundimonas sp.]